MIKPLAGVLIAVSIAVAGTGCGAVQQPPPGGALPTSTASQTTSPTQGWSPFVWRVAGIRATVPGQPTEEVTQVPVSGALITLYLAIIHSNIVLIEFGSTTSSVAIPSSYVDTALRGSIKTFAGNIKAKVTSSRAMKFRGHPARTAALKLEGHKYTLLIFQRDARRSVFIIAPAGVISAQLAQHIRLI